MTDILILLYAFLCNPFHDSWLVLFSALHHVFSQHQRTTDPILQDVQLRELLRMNQERITQWMKPLVQNLTDSKLETTKKLSSSQKKWMKLSEKMVELSALIEKTRIKH
jgi:hypothetical protein